MVLDPPRRTFSEPKGRKGLRDVDAGERAQRLRAWVWSVAAGLPLGGAVGLMLGNLLIGLLVGPLVIYGVVAAITAFAGRGASTLYMPSGSTTPRKKEYSRAQALEIRGDFSGAIRAYEAEILDDPDTAEPYLRIARLLRDELKDTEAAVGWFRRVQREARPRAGEALRAHRELAEIFLYALREPRRAAPELARLAETYPHTPDGEWAARELAEIKAEMVREREGPLQDPEDRPPES